MWRFPVAQRRLNTRAPEAQPKWLSCHVDGHRVPLSHWTATADHAIRRDRGSCLKQNNIRACTVGLGQGSDLSKSPHPQAVADLKALATAGQGTGKIKSILSVAHLLAEWVASS